MVQKRSYVRIFIDESGTSYKYKPGVNNPGERYFTLAACILKRQDYSELRKEIKTLKQRYKKYIGDRELKSRWIRRSNPVNIDPDDPPAYEFWKYEKEGVVQYKKFCKDLEILVSNTHFEITSVGVDKIVAQTLYPHKDILQTTLTDLWERIFIYHAINRVGDSRILFDPRKSIDDQIMRGSYEDFRRHGSWFVDQARLSYAKLYKRVFSPSSQESVGIQLADFCAYPIKRYVEDKTYPFFRRVIKPKLCTNVIDKKTNKTINMGVKVSLSR